MIDGQQSTLPTIQSRFFRLLFLTGAGMAMLAALGVGIADMFAARRMIVNNLVHYSEAISRVAAYNIQNHEELSQHLKDFSGQPGLEKSCIYSTDNVLIASWSHPAIANPWCPGVISSTGTYETLLALTIARPVLGEDGTYLGFIYLEGNLREINVFAGRIILTIVLLIIAASGLCALLARRMARRISQPLADAVRHIECLYSESEGSCALPQSSATDETAKLINAIARMHDKLAATMMPLERVEAHRRWYEGKLAGLLSLLRSRLPQDSVLVPSIGDYAMLMEIKAAHYVVPAAVFSIRSVADRALTSAKKIQPPSPLLHVTLSVKPDMPVCWIGRSQHIEGLLRHLLLISLKRTRSGMVCLRLEAGQGNNSESILYFTLEDTGSDLSTMQVERWLSEARMEISAASEVIDISWVVVAQVVQALGGELNWSAVTGQGFSLTGWVQLPAALQSVPDMPKKAALQGGYAPLLLMVEDDRVNQQTQRALFEKAGCKVFTVSTGEQALEWAGILPYSLIVLDQILPDMPGAQVAAKLDGMVLDNLIPPMPIIVLSAASALQSQDGWKNMHVASLMAKPLSSEAVERICHGIQPVDDSFFCRCGQDVIRELRASLGNRMPELHGQLYQYIREFCDALNNKSLTPMDIALKAHEVKSASLTLGYDRLSACLGALEFALRSGDRIFIEDNLPVVGYYLHMAADYFQNPAQRVALSS